MPGGFRFVKRRGGGRHARRRRRPTRKGFEATHEGDSSRRSWRAVIAKVRDLEWHGACKVGAQARRDGLGTEVGRKGDGQ